MLNVTECQIKTNQIVSSELGYVVLDGVGW